jgi:hypothetical protein
VGNDVIESVLASIFISAIILIFSFLFLNRDRKQ